MYVMSEKMNRRSFVKKSALASAAGLVGLSLQEQALLAKTSCKEAAPAAKACD
jgi:anaerobic selenocysteine-containing dehydrogenase